MNNTRIIALLMLLGGLGALAWGGWQYFDQRREIRIGDARLVIEDADISPAVWVGGVLFLAGGITMVAAGGKQN